MGTPLTLVERWFVISPLSPFFFWSDSIGEYYDRSGARSEKFQRESPGRMVIGKESSVMEIVTRWELMEVNNGNTEESGEELCLASATPLEVKSWDETSWEESDLARFSKFLGVSTERLEKDILEFLEGGSRKVQCKEEGARFWLSNEVKVVELERDENSDNVRGCGEEFGLWEVFLIGELRMLKLCGWDFDMLGQKVPGIVGDGGGTIFYFMERSSQGSLNGAMRRFAQVVDDLELLDLPLQGGVFSWSGGRNNQSWARLDCFLVTQSRLDLFRGVVQSRLPKPTSDHFPILLKGGGLRRGPSPFRFENMWLKVDGFKDLLRDWWQGVGRRGRASFRLAAKMKVLKEKIKVWNRDVFGRLEVNKSSALQQVDFWDMVECDRGLSERETKLKNETKETFKKVGTFGRNPLETIVKGVVAKGRG
ncbi:hypothetical protein CK203_029756 [Vitis vinifera]|uniref:DUF4283 domain-containing protein n=1 Tax=Vitis vinifera TaxID=29760 RepID=A0A438IIC8_VITVI|nr:hypothetical protein CK203_029756 [Vitis vinifera]